jgi:hypothetical protein
MRRERYIQTAVFVACIAVTAHATDLLCHRTANQEVPENTLASLEAAALFGCNVVEIDLRRTLDGQIVLDHDGVPERPTDGIGEVARIMGSYRCQIKLVEAIAMLHVATATHVLEQQAFRPGEDFSQMNAVVASFQLWDRVAQNAQPAIRALGSTDTGVADRAEWILVQGGTSVLPEVRRALDDPDSAVRRRAIAILAWQGDSDALPRLQAMERSGSSIDAALLSWAIRKILTLHPVSLLNP